MNEPFRLMPVVVALDVYRRSVTAAGSAVRHEVKHLGAFTRRVARRAVRRLARPAPEVMPSLISQRIRATRNR